MMNGTEISRKVATGCKQQINLLKGWPNKTLLPSKLLREAIQATLLEPSLSDEALQYGSEQGKPEIRTRLATWLDDFYTPTCPTAADQIAITAGASTGLATILNLFTDPVHTRKVWLVAPCYMLAFRIFDDAGLSSKMAPVPEIEDGIDLEMLKQELLESEQARSVQEESEFRQTCTRPWTKTYRYVIYAVPTFSNPSSRTWSTKTREALIRLARNFDALIITDDVYDFLQWSTHVDAVSYPSKASAPRLIDLDCALDGGSDRESADGFGNTVSNASFSKISAPGLRAGWIQGTSKLAHAVANIGTSASSGGPAQTSSIFLDQALRSGSLQHHISTVLQPAYSCRWRTLMNAIEEYLVPLGVTSIIPRDGIMGGFFVWITLPDRFLAEDVARAALHDENLIVADGQVFSIPRVNVPCNDFKHSIRLSFSYVEVNELTEGVKRLRNVLLKLIKSREQTN